jgi:ADP-heptose:LPS heptosyltransferase
MNGKVCFSLRPDKFVFEMPKVLRGFSGTAILLDESDGIGDVCTASFVVAGLKRMNPKMHLTQLVKKHIGIEVASLFIPHSDQIIDRIPSKMKWDLSLSCNIQQMNGFHFGSAAIRAMLETAGYQRTYSSSKSAHTLPVMPKISIPEDAVSWSLQFENFILLAPFCSNCGNKREWPYFLELERSLIDRGFKCIILSAESHRTEPYNSKKVSCETPARMMALIKRAKLVVGNDSGIAHLAGMAGVPTVAICACTVGESIFGMLPSVYVVQRGRGCGLCSQFSPSRCLNPFGSSRCSVIEDISVREVYNTVLKEINTSASVRMIRNFWRRATLRWRP